MAVYFANVNQQASSISQPDVSPFQDLLLDCEGQCELDLLLQSPGGDIDTAEKLVYMLRQRARSFRVIVVERAKSAATLIALATDEILHGMVIDWQEARQMGLNVSFLPPDDPLWRQLWSLHLLYEVESYTSSMAKMFETRKVSIPFSNPS